MAADPAAGAMPPDLVRACYRLLLGREPENDEVVREKAALPSYDALLTAFLTCEEYLRRFPPHMHAH